MVTIWRIPEDFPEHLILRYDRHSSPDRFLFTSGTSVSEPNPVPSFVTDALMEQLRNWDNLPNSARLPLVNRRFASLLLELAPNDVEMFTARIASASGASQEYSLVNITHTARVIDHRASSYSLVPETQQIMSFKTLRLLPDCLGTRKLARNEEYRSHILVSDDVRSAILESGLRGVEFVHASDLI